MAHKIYKLFTLILGLLSISVESFGQDFSNRGKEFWVAYGHHQFMEPGESPANGQNMVIYLSAEQAAIVTVTVDSSANMFGGDWTRTYAVPANTVISTGTATPISGFPLPLTPGPIPKSGTYDFRLYSLPCSFSPPGAPCGSEQIFRGKGIHITSDVPIVAYAHIYGSTASGATMLMPVESWGYTYTSINSNQTNASNSFSWMYVVAKNDSTVLSITPSVTTRLSKPPGVPFTVTLHKGQIYQLVGQTTGNNGLELTGTTVKSIANSAGNCYPVAVFSGSSRTGGLCNNSSGSRDNDMQQAFPQQAWGKRYLTSPLSTSGSISSYSKSPFKIVVKDPTTVVKRNGTVLTGLVNNYYRFESDTAEFIVADKPIMVGQFMAAAGSCLSGAGDPEMMFISPIEQAIRRTGFYRTTLESISVNYVSLIIPTAGLNTLTIQGTPFLSIPAGSAHSYPHPGLAGYSIAIRRWTAQQGQVIMQSDSAFNAITYGLGSAESYGYNAGTFIKNLNAVGSIFNVNDTSGATSNAFTCTNTPVKLKVLLGYETPPSKIVWRLSQVTGGISPNADVTDNSPTPTATVVQNGITYLQFELPGTYTFSSTGIFRIPLLATHPSIENCTMTEELSYDIDVRGKPVADFAINSTGCYLDTVLFAGQNMSSNGFNINQWKYTFHDASISNAKDTSKIYAAPGVYDVNLRIISQEGCVSDTTKQLSLSAAPVVAFTTSPNVCSGQPITFNDNSTYTGAGNINNSYWDFGDGTVQTFTNADPVTHTYATYGTYVVRHTAGVGSSCVGDTATSTVTVYAQPNAAFSYPAGCLPANGTVQFTSTATAPDGQPITGHLWNFGDPGSGAANTSTLANPTHNYPTFGNYTITYQSTTANGCFKDTTVNATFNLAPTFSYPALAPVCQETNTVNVNTASVTNGVPGNGIYSGPGTSSTGIFTPAIAGPGTHIINYVYSTTGGCVDSVQQSIVVYPTPSAAFAVAGSGCLPANGNVDFTYTGSPITGQTYAWNFGDPASGSNNTSTLQNPSHTYATGAYTITLTVTTPDGCVKDSILNTNFTVTPALNYPLLTSTCENITGPISVATATVTNGVTGTGVYSGPGTSANGDFNPAVAGPGTHTITYTFTSTGNCVATITSTITVNAKPTANFTYPTAPCLPTTGVAQFNYTGSMSAGQTYLWNFGDPASGANNTSTIANPTHTYTNTGSYTVSVQVTNTNGCVDTKTITTTFSVTPALTYPALTAVCESATGTLTVATATVTNGVTGTGVYSGPGTSANGDFNPAVAGPGIHTITYTFTSTGNCVATITSTITVNAKPAADFTYPTAPCLPTTGVAQFNYTGSMSAGQTYLWNFGDPASGANNTSTIANPTHTYTNTGSYTVSVQVTNTNGCVDTKTITTTFSVTPALTYPALTAICESATGTLTVATATVTNGVSGTGVYSGPGTSANGDFDPAVAGPGTHTITYTFTSSGNCVATITSTITVNAKPTADFTYPTAPCLPTTGVAQFNYTGSMSAGQTYLWNFGDPASGANNTSTIANPTHTYTNTGSYTVSVQVTNTNGCVDTKTITTTFSVTPALTYPALTAICESATGTLTVATATVTNGVSGTGVYSGPGTSTNGDFDPAVAGPGTHTITYIFTSSGNCVATISSTITVNAKPIISFNATPAAICENGTINITSTSTGNTQSWNWNFGDGNTATYNNGNPFTYSYTTFGTKTITLTTTNAEGCVSNIASQIVTVASNPVASFNPPASVCIPGNAVFTNSSTNADGSPLNYLWDFGNGNTSTSMNGSTTYSNSTPVNVTLTVTNSTGCTAITTQSFSAFFDKPNAAFTVSEPVICQGKPTVFTNLSTAPNSSIASQLWQFDDGTTSTQNAPSKTFTTPGVHIIRLTVTSNEGCVSDEFLDSVIVYLQPIVDAGPSFIVAPGTSVTFAPVVNNTSIPTFTWSPSTGLSNASLLTPTLVATVDQTYTLTATVAGTCVASDFITVKIIRPLKIPNAFSPNGDGINDLWMIENITDYKNATVDIFNRYGQKIFTSFGYGKAWDGTNNGKPLPLATYYYIIDLKTGQKPLNGSITLIK